jgi:hypothetical protein
VLAKLIEVEQDPDHPFADTGADGGVAQRLPRSCRTSAAGSPRTWRSRVGRDLQFIRINGTVVGALAGLSIHSVSVLLG